MGQTASQQLANRLAQAASPEPIKEPLVTDPTPSADQMAALQVAIDAAVAAATADLQAKLDLAGETEAVKTAVAAATAPLQTQLDTLATSEAAAVARVAELEAEAASFKEFLDKKKKDDDDAKAAAEAEEAAKATAAARLAVLVAPLAEQGLGWTEATANERIDHYAGLTEEAWTASLTHLREAAASARVAGEPPAKGGLNITGSSVIGGTATTGKAAEAAAVDAQGRPIESNVPASADAALVLANRRRISGMPH